MAKDGIINSKSIWNLGAGEPLLGLSGMTKRESVCLQQAMAKRKPPSSSYNIYTMERDLIWKNQSHIQA